MALVLALLADRREDQLLATSVSSEESRAVGLETLPLRCPPVLERDAVVGGVSIVGDGDWLHRVISPLHISSRATSLRRSSKCRNGSADACCGWCG